MTPASPVLPTVTVHSVGCLCVLVLRDTTELLETLQEWNVLVSLNCVAVPKYCAADRVVLWWVHTCGVLYEIGLRVGVMGHEGHQMQNSDLKIKKTLMMTE